jgi:hypothetical protein
MSNQNQGDFKGRIQANFGASGIVGGRRRLSTVDSEQLI